MKEDVINGIKYCLDEDNLTAEVIDLREDFKLDETKLTAEKIFKMIRWTIRRIKGEVK